MSLRIENMLWNKLKHKSLTGHRLTLNNLVNNALNWTSFFSFRKIRLFKLAYLGFLNQLKISWRLFLSQLTEWVLASMISKLVLCELEFLADSSINSLLNSLALWCVRVWQMVARWSRLHLGCLNSRYTLSSSPRLSLYFRSFTSVIPLQYAISIPL